MNILWASSSNPDMNDAIGRFVAGLIPHMHRGFADHASMGVFDESGMMIAGIIWHDWNPEHGTIEFSGAGTSKRWLTPAVLKEMFEYPFLQLGCQTVFTRNSAQNVMANGRGLQRMLKAYGFEAIRIPRLFGRHEDGVLHILHDDVWRSNRFHRQQTRSAA